MFFSKWLLQLETCAMRFEKIFKLLVQPIRKLVSTEVLCCLLQLVVVTENTSKKISLPNNCQVITAANICRLFFLAPNIFLYPFFMLN